MFEPAVPLVLSRIAIETACHMVVLLEAFERFDILSQTFDIAIVLGA